MVDNSYLVSDSFIDEELKKLLDTLYEDIKLHPYYKNFVEAEKILDSSVNLRMKFLPNTRMKEAFKMEEKKTTLVNGKKFDYDVYSLDEYDYPLDEKLIAQSPADKRDQSRLLVMNRETGELKDQHFYDIVNYFRKGDVLVRNNTKVIPARLFGVKEETGAHVEVLLLKVVAM